MADSAPLSHPVAPLPVGSTIAETLAALKPGARYARPRPPGSADGWMLSTLAQKAGRPLIVLTADPLEAQRLAEEIPLYAPGLRVRQLPDWETLPYDVFSPQDGKRVV